MKNLLIACGTLSLVSCVWIAGCAPKYIVQPRPVEVDLPVLYCPAITDIAPMPPIVLESENLGSLDPNDPDTPGKVARAYHVDMVNLTQRLHELNNIEQQRADQAAAMKQKIGDYQAKIQAIHDANMKKITDTVVKDQKNGK